MANTHTNQPDKDKWIGRERLRWARAFGVPMAETTPANFPPNTLHTMRAVCALSLQDAAGQGQEKLVQALEALYAAMWTDNAEIAKPDVFGPRLVKVFGEETAKKGGFSLITSLSLSILCSFFHPYMFGFPFFLPIFLAVSHRQISKRHVGSVTSTRRGGRRCQILAEKSQRTPKPPSQA